MHFLTKRPTTMQEQDEPPRHRRSLTFTGPTPATSCAGLLFHLRDDGPRSHGLALFVQRFISREGVPMTTREMERTFKFVGVGSHFLLMGITAVVIGVLVSFEVVWGR